MSLIIDGSAFRTFDAQGAATQAVAVTLSNSTNLAKVSRALFVGGTGDVAVVFADDTVVTFTAVQAGSILPVAAKRVNVTNTTATSIVALN